MTKFLSFSLGSWFREAVQSDRAGSGNRPTRLLHLTTEDHEVMAESKMKITYNPSTVLGGSAKPPSKRLTTS